MRRRSGWSPEPGLSLPRFEKLKIAHGVYLEPSRTPEGQHHSGSWLTMESTRKACKMVWIGLGFLLKKETSNKQDSNQTG